MIHVIKYTRHQKIIRLLGEAPVLSVNSLAESLSVSAITIRRDLAELEEQKVVVRNHGGAVLAERHQIAPVVQRVGVNPDGKQRIAKAAAKLIHPGNSIILDAGSTVGLLARYVNEMDTITVLTPSLFCATEISNSRITVMMPGGVILARDMVLIGPECENYFKKIEVDITFLSTTGVRSGQGFTMVSPFQYSIKQAMMKAASKKVLLVDHTKFDKSGLNLFASFSDVDCVITDGPISDEDSLFAMEACGVEIIYAT